MKKHLTILLTGLIILVILGLKLVTYSVNWKESVLVTTFGRITAVQDEPGLKWKWPWQRLVRFDGRLRTLIQDGSETQTSDMQNIIVSLYVNWRISDPDVFYQRFRSTDVAAAEAIVNRAQRDIKGWLNDTTNVFARYDLDRLVTLDDQQFALDDVEKKMLEDLKTKALTGEGYGVEIMDLGIRRLGVPDSVSTSVFDRMKEDRNAQVSRLIADGQAQADSIKGRAEAQATTIRAEAQARARAIEGQGDAQAAQYYAKFLEEPELANFLRKLETLRRTLNERTTIVLDAQAQPYKLLKAAPEAWTGPAQ